MSNNFILLKNLGHLGKNLTTNREAENAFFNFIILNDY